MKSIVLIKWRFVIAVLASAAIIFLSLFEWQITDKISPFGFLFFAVPMLIIFIIAVVFSITAIFKVKIIGFVALIPIGVNAIALLIVLFVPFTDLWLKADFALYKKQREEIVAHVNNGVLKPTVSPYNNKIASINLRPPSLLVSNSKLVIEEHQEGKYVFFYTFHGILDHYSGFLYVPHGGDPRNYSDLGEKHKTSIVTLEDNWFYVSHH